MDEKPTSRAVTHEQAGDAAMAALREAGWQVEMTCFAAPVQLEGVLPCGELFYFRSRHDEILLAVGGEDPGDGAPWQQQASSENVSMDVSGLFTIEGVVPVEVLGASVTG
jgi:hypothetical protein